MPTVLYVSLTSMQKNSLGTDKIHTKATYRQDDIRCRNWIPLTFMPYGVLQITTVRLKLIAMVVLWHCEVWVYVVSQSLCCLNLHTTKQMQHILNISYAPMLSLSLQAAATLFTNIHILCYSHLAFLAIFHTLFKLLSSTILLSTNTISLSRVCCYNQPIL